MEKPIIVTPEIVSQFQQKIINHKPKYSPAPPIAEVKQFQQTEYV
jgi:folate-dependent phosphoribosylglycinamide formyltransferase PurN